MAAPLGFKTFNTGDVLTAADTNGYLMQGVWTFANSAARSAAVTSPQEGNVSFLKDTNSLEIYDGAAWVAYGSGDITGVTAGTGISGGGTSGTVTVTNSMATAIDAKGDLIAGTGADTFDRLAVGSNNTVLTADSSTATGLKWATPSSGSLTLLSTTSLSGSSTSISVTPTGYNKLYILIDSPTVSSTTGLGMRVNGISSTTYGYVTSTANGSPGFTTNGAVNADGALFTGNVTYLNTSSQRGKFWCYLYDPNDTGTRYKTFNYGGTWENNSNLPCSSMGSGGLTTTSAVSSIQFYPPGQTWNGGTVYVYGVK